MIEAYLVEIDQYGFLREPLEMENPHKLHAVCVFGDGIWLYHESIDMVESLTSKEFYAKGTPNYIATTAKCVDVKTTGFVSAVMSYNAIAEMNREIDINFINSVRALQGQDKIKTDQDTKDLFKSAVRSKVTRL